uniref:Serine protease n=1 Tax=Anabas testudineus TaxID=64144 RepID=A0A3Q1IG00_ANATE
HCDQPEADKEFAIATHFPCSCLGKYKLLIILTPSDKQQKLKKVQEVQLQDYTVHPKDKYSVFYIDTVGGKNTTSKKLFRNNIFKEFKYLCVYRERGMTVGEALQRDGRFIDNLDKFTLSNNENPESKTELTLKAPEKSEGQYKETRQCSDVAPQGEISVKTELVQELSRENFGKIQSSFSEVHRVRKLLKLGESVCYLEVHCSSQAVQGTGFMLFDNYVLTNGHLFTMVNFPADMLMKPLEENVTAVFNVEDPTAAAEWKKCKVRGIVDLRHDELDYAILELEIDQNKPQGLLKKFCPMPENGEACVVGHPEGGVKKMDPTCIIEKQIRKQKVIERLYPFIFHKIINNLKDNDIDTTYNTFMYHGSSGSPVFDGDGGVFGLHTGGFPYKHLNQTQSVIEYAQPLLTIFESFVSRLKKNGYDELLETVKKEAKGNPDLEKICGLELDHKVAHVDDESMETD